MSSVSISLITVTYNAAGTIERCIQSVIDQNYPCLEYIIIDGLSKDATPAIIAKYKQHISLYVNEPDNGIYDAMNKGITLATGDIIGILNADDHFAYNQVLKDVSEAFASSGADIVYGDIDYINNRGNITRKWRSGLYKPGHFNAGWMPPHPSFYAKRELFINFDMYKPQYGSAADYELMLRFMHITNINIYYLNKVMVKMQLGGISNKSVANRFKAWRNDYKAMIANQVRFPYIVIILKPLRKIIQYFR